MKTSDDIVIYFGLTKGEGTYPTLDLLTDAERADLRPCIDFSMSWSAATTRKPRARIIEIEILYDGASPCIAMDAGFSIQKKEFTGYPCPIVRFRFDRPMQVERFEQNIYGYYYVETELMRKREIDSYVAEDYNGYTEHMSVEDIDLWRQALAEANLLNGRKYRFPEGLACGDGITLRGLDFISAPIDLNATIHAKKPRSSAKKSKASVAKIPEEPITKPSNSPRAAWSERLQQQTREAIAQASINPITGKLHLKHIDGLRGTVLATDLLANWLHVFSESLNTTYVFPNVHSLISHGWAID